MTQRSSRSDHDRFWSKVRLDETGCWLWLGATTEDGYAQFSTRENKHGWELGHRWIYRHTIGEIPDGFTLDHLCRIRHCVHPGHLEPCTNQENTLRGVGLAAMNAVKTHCSRGHEFSESNTYTRIGKRWCRICRREYMRAWKLNRRKV